MTAAGQVRVKKNILKTPASTGASGGQLLIMYHHQERRDEDLIHRAANTHTHKLNNAVTEVHLSELPLKIMLIRAKAIAPSSQ